MTRPFSWKRKAEKYPEPSMFGTTPAHGLIIRHAEGIEVSDFKVVARAADARPCFVLDDANRIDFSNIQPDRARGHAGVCVEQREGFQRSEMQIVG